MVHLAYMRNRQKRRIRGGGGGQNYSLYLPDYVIVKEMPNSQMVAKLISKRDTFRGKVRRVLFVPYICLITVDPAVLILNLTKTNVLSKLLQRDFIWNTD